MSIITYKIVQGRVRDVDAVVDDLILEHRVADLACDIEDLVRETSELADAVEGAAKKCGPGVQLGITKQKLISAHLFRMLLIKMIVLISKVEGLADEVRRAGYSIDGAIDLPVVKHQLTNAKTEFEKNWMLPSEENIRLSKQQLADGKFVIL